MSENKEPTDEQLKKFWEWCGFTHIEYLRCSCHPDQKFHYWHDPKGQFFADIPALDLNNLFKYAVPKLQELGWMARIQFSPLRDNDTGKQLYDWTGYASLFYVKSDKTLASKHDTKEAINNKPELALFWAIWEVIP